MSGEKSKGSGEAGEKVAQIFMEHIGWNNVTAGKNFDIPCIKKNEHKPGGERQSHGIDYLVSYECPLEQETQENVLISVKYRKTYSAITSTFKSFLKDIAYAMGCLKLNADYNAPLSSRIKQRKTTGVVLWLTYEDDKDKGIIEEVENFRNTDDLSFDRVFLVDNKRLSFISKTLDFAKKTFPQAKIEFLYPNTGLNNRTLHTRQTSGPILPVQYINSSVIPLKVVEGLEENLMLSLIDNFSEDNLSRLIGLAQNLTEGWGSKIILCFPDYHELKNNQTFLKTKQSFSDKAFTQKLSIKCFQENFRSWEGE